MESNNGCPIFNIAYPKTNIGCPKINIGNPKNGKVMLEINIGCPFSNIGCPKTNILRILKTNNRIDSILIDNQ